MAALWNGVCRISDRAVAAVLVALVIVYRWTLSPLLGRHCRFQPTCSVYFRQAVEKYGGLRGAAFNYGARDHLATANRIVDAGRNSVVGFRIVCVVGPAS